MRNRSLFVALTLVLALSFASVARAETFTVDCGPHAVPAGGLYVVGAVDTTYDVVEDDVDLAGVSCFTSGGGGATPVTPLNGIVGFCPEKDQPTVCTCHADVAPSETFAYCLQGPAEAPELAVEAEALVFHAGEIVEELPAKPGKRKGHNK
jgi:hypothetical protein